MTDDILRQQDGLGNMKHGQITNAELHRLHNPDDSDIRMRNGSDWYASYPDPNNLTDLIGAPTLADHDRQLLEDYDAWCLAMQPEWMELARQGGYPVVDSITAFLESREVPK